MLVTKAQIMLQLEIGQTNKNAKKIILESYGTFAIFFKLHYMCNAIKRARLYS